MTTEINPGEIKIKLDTPLAGKVSLKDMGVTDEALTLQGGLLRLVIDLENIKEHHYYQVPTLEFTYKENMGESHWQCDFNEETILDKMDNHGHSTILLLDRKKIESLEHRHENALVVHAEFPEAAHVSAADSYMHLFK